MKKFLPVVDAGESESNLSFRKRSRNLYRSKGAPALMVMDKDK